MTEINDLPEARRQLNEFVRVQRSSIGHFWDADDSVFFRTEMERVEQSAKPNRTVESAKIHRLTSTVTCIESILEAPDWCDSESQWNPTWARSALDTFMQRSLATDDGWMSDGAAWVYCRTRTLGGSMRLLDRWGDDHKQMAVALIEQAWGSRHDSGGSFGLRESIEDPRSNPQLEMETGDGQYPANAFLTYWGLLAASLAHDGGFPLNAAGPAGERSRSAAYKWMVENLSAATANCP